MHKVTFVTAAQTSHVKTKLGQLTITTMLKQTRRQTTDHHFLSQLVYELWSSCLTFSYSEAAEKGTGWVPDWKCLHQTGLDHILGYARGGCVISLYAHLS
jgi:hypothetical protein